MSRIIAGTAGGLRLETPRGDATRPTSDRVREALFSVLEARWDLAGARVLDLYAGSGALGLEAWSRGAGAVTLVEADRPTAALIERNAGALGCDAATVVCQRVATALAAGTATAYDVVLSDPPYPLTEEDLAGDLGLLADHGWLGAGTLVVIERGIRSPEPRWPPGLAPLPGRRARKKYGETALWFAEWHPSGR